ncbi:hypothetical protein [Aquibacillus rhizosphaerae]|uniref:Uncharacterized protein n=1 Tax=Aquibacillus rhizosphaerae TaxID=3051431 RepID=A0ABT7LAU3_9BACI|nr:hypothetical protein [Aquibacillus sp. LR5S19]MDL4842983.1 hypothetical protein [Aquibacillus sp. LR5S19]
MVKKTSSIVIIGFMLVSWTIGIYFLNINYDPVLIIPTLNDFLWMSPFKAILGLTSVVTAFTILLFLSQYTFKSFFQNRKKFYIAHISHHTAWILIVMLQVKVIAFNLGICH